MNHLEQEDVLQSWQARQYQRAIELKHALQDDMSSSQIIERLSDELFLATEMLEAMKHAMQAEG